MTGIIFDFLIHHCLIAHVTEFAKDTFPRIKFSMVVYKISEN